VPKGVACRNVPFTLSTAMYSTVPLFSKEYLKANVLPFERNTSLVSVPEVPTVEVTRNRTLTLRPV
jgi:hypothetical protein